MPPIKFVAGPVLAGFLPLSVYALGLGEIDLKSALNEPFLAEIPVTSESTEDLSAVRIELAPAATFERYGLVRPAFLADFDFRLVPERGRSVLKVSSGQPVSEPFVTMLLEVTWPQGRLLREYTVLLDPPVFATNAPAVTAAPPAAEPADPPVSRPQATPTPAAAPASARAPAPQSVPGTYGPVQRSDTLWGIASRVRPDASVDMNQMMLAIYRANPEAFAGNINRLRAGAILRVPDAGQLAELSSAEANAEVRRQNNAWQGGAAASPASAKLELVPPPAAGESAPAPAAPAPAGAATSRAEQAQVAALEAELAERDRLIALRDRELQALQAQLAALEGRDAPAADEPPLDADEAPVAEESELDAPVFAEDLEPEAAEPAAEAVEPAPSVPPAVSTVTTATAGDEPSFLGQLFGSLWLYLGIGIALIAGLFVMRRRRAEEPTGRWESLTAAADADLDEESREATERLRAPRAEQESFVVEEPEPSAARSPSLDEVGPEESLLDRTLSSESPLNFDQEDPIAEAEFHMAYGLYDQAADLLIKALEAEPDRRDLRRKLIDVYFVWENKDGFLREAHAFHDLVGGAGDADWNKVLIMGKQLCPGEQLFAASPAPAQDADDDLDLALLDDAGGAVDVALDDEGEGLDFDMTAGPEGGEGGLDFEMEEQAEVEYSPTLASDQPETSQTVDAPAAEPGSETVETPTLASPREDWGAEGQVDQTAALDLDELGLDLSDFEDADLADDDGDDALSGVADASLLEERGDFGDVNLGLDSTAEVPAVGDDLLADEDFGEVGDIESTAEMRGVDSGPAESADLEALTEALSRNTPGAELGDTAEQPRPRIEDTAEQPRPAADSLDLGLDLGLGDEIPDDGDAAGTTSAAPRPEGPTMTEVGTKLDLARAYIDMGDPDGARSILDEVLEEGDSGQRQEAQKLLDDLTS